MAKEDVPEQAETQRPTGPMGPSRVLARDISVYYSNCAMVATTPRDISMFFGRLVPTADDKGGQTLAELYERQIYMTIEQAEDLAKMLTQTVANFKARKPSGGAT